MKQYLGTLALLSVLILTMIAIGFMDGLRTWTPENCASQVAPVAESGVRTVALITVPFLTFGLLLQVAYHCGVEVCRRTLPN